MRKWGYTHVARSLLQNGYESVEKKMCIMIMQGMNQRSGHLDADSKRGRFV